MIDSLSYSTVGCRRINWVDSDGVVARLIRSQRITECKPCGTELAARIRDLRRLARRYRALRTQARIGPEAHSPLSLSLAG